MAERNYGGRPTHNLRAYNAGTKRSSKVGAAWANPDGSISIRLEPFVTLSARDLEGWTLTLFTNDPLPEEKA